MVTYVPNPMGRPHRLGVGNHLWPRANGKILAFPDNYNLINVDIAIDTGLLV